LQLQLHLRAACLPNTSNHLHATALHSCCGSARFLVAAGH
jgi:hypothetical protein